MQSNRKKRAIVMGATSGIGLEVAKLLAEKGWTVGIAGRRERLLADIMSANKGIIAKKQIDITEPNAVSLLGELIEEMSGIDLYVHSSGIGWHNESLNERKEHLTVETNTVGFTRMLTAVFNKMSVEKSGHIVCITSIAGTKGLGAAPAYSSTKRFQSHYLECLSQLAHIRKVDIKITDIRPGFVDTALIAGSDFPLKMSAKSVAGKIIAAIDGGKTVKVIDWRYNILVFLWRMIPRWIWIRMRIK